MAKNNRYTRRRYHNLRFIEDHLRRKTDRQRAQRSHPMDEPFYSANADAPTTAPMTGVVTVPLNTHNGIYEAGFRHQGDDGANLGGIRAGVGVDGGDVMRIGQSEAGLRKVHAATNMLNDQGQFTVWVKGYNGGAAGSGDYEYALSVHQWSSDATPVDEETLIIRWENNDGATPTDYLRLYPNITDYPTTYVEIELDEADWQEEAWHKITGTWSYQDQEWTLFWDDEEGTLVTPATPDTIPWPEWNEFTFMEVFTDLNWANNIYHDVQFLGFSRIESSGGVTDHGALTGLADDDHTQYVQVHTAAAADPTVNDDTGDGYRIGTMWHRADTDQIWVLVDATLGAAKWLELPTSINGGPGYFGDGSDGATTTAGNVSLSADVYSTDYTISNGDILTMNGCKLFATGTVTIAGEATASGDDGGNGTAGANGGMGVPGAGGTGGAKGTAPTQSSVAGGAAGEDGGDGGVGSVGGGPAGNGDNGTSGDGAANSIGSNGSAGGDGGDGGDCPMGGGGGTGGTGGPAGARVVSAAAYGGVRDIQHMIPWRAFPAGIVPAMIMLSAGSGSGAGGAGGGSQGPAGAGGGGAGGASGTGAGAVVIIANRIVISGTGSITAVGGDGGDGGNGGDGFDDGASQTGGGGAGAGGAGGCGGVVVLIYNELVNNGSISVAAGSGGTGGTGGSGQNGGGAGSNGNNGANGTAGETIEFPLSAIDSVGV